jgi:hypothetical protein
MTFPKALPLPTYDLLGVTFADWPSHTRDIDHIVSAWFSEFIVALGSGNGNSLTALFIDQSPVWRDLLALSWDYRTVVSKGDIRRFLDTVVHSAEINEVKLADDTQLRQIQPDLAWIHFNFTFTTKHGVCSGIGRLVPTRERIEAQSQTWMLNRLFTSTTKPAVLWKAHGIFTLLEGLKQYPELIGPLRETRTGTDWAERRNKELEFEQDPQVIVIGGGQSGLMMGARLKYLGVRTLIVDKKPRIGDQWRGRYDGLTLHNPVWYDHFPYLP